MILIQLLALVNGRLNFIRASWINFANKMTDINAKICLKKCDKVGGYLIPRIIRIA